VPAQVTYGKKSKCNLPKKTKIKLQRTEFNIYKRMGQKVKLDIESPLQIYEMEVNTRILVTGLPPLQMK
jgi:hypothetical protein